MKHQHLSLGLALLVVILLSTLGYVWANSDATYKKQLEDVDLYYRMCNKERLELQSRILAKQLEIYRLQQKQ